MVLQALTRYYDILADDPQSDIAPFGYSVANVSFVLILSQQGELLDIIQLFVNVQRGKKTVEVARRMKVPEQIKRAGIAPPPNFLCDNSAYILGISARDAENPNYSSKRFEAFRDLNLKLLAEAQCPGAEAVVAFLQSYDPCLARDHPVIGRHLEAILQGRNLVFKLDGSPGFVHEAPEIRRVWEAHKAQTNVESNGQCLVTGKIGPIARLHKNITGIRGANTAGAALVSFNERAYESYNRTKAQGFNSPTSEKAAFAYTTALNYLLSRDNPNRKFTIGDTTVVYWAESADKVYASIFQGLVHPDWIETEAEEKGDATGRDAQAEHLMSEIAQKVKKGEPLDTNNLLEKLDPGTRFYVLGLAPNAARVSVRFFLQEPFARFIQRIMAHYEHMDIIKEYEWQPGRISLRNILEETVSKKSTDKSASPLMAGAVMRAILNNTPYPAALYYAIINRIRADMDDKGIQKISYVRAAVIKAFLIRKYRNQPQHPFQEVLSMSLNEQSTIPAYALGRLFAVLESVQIEAAKPVKLNSTIKDRYFTSACASPKSVFPTLLQLSQHHIAKAEYGNVSDRRIQDILGLLDVEKNPIPARLTLDEQGIFVLGYYHQRAAFYVSKTDKNAVETTSTEN